MNSSQMRDAVIEKAYFADEATLKCMLDAHPPKAGEAEIAAEIARLDDVMARYESGESRSWTWEEVKEHLVARRANHGQA